jgi:8-oxo-dGTP diphosphatase
MSKPQISDWLNPPKTVEAVLCHIRRGDEFLLLLKSKGRFGEGFWNAPGGKIEIGESSEQAARREVDEETGLSVLEMSRVGDLKFYFGKDKQTPDWQVDVFLCPKFSGELKSEVDEGELRWFNKSDIPYDQMWADDRYWMPLLIQGKKFSGSFVFSENGKELLKSTI